MSQPPANSERGVGIDSFINLPEDVSFQVKREDVATKEINLKRANWQLLREKITYYSAIGFVFPTAISSLICLYYYSDAAGRKYAASTILTSIVAAILGYLTGQKSKSVSKD